MTGSNLFGYARGLRPRSDQRLFYFAAVVAGVASGYYTYHATNYEQVLAYNAAKAAGGAPAAK